jgi:NitT/TauT family transport system substrate-binding protein
MRLSRRLPALTLMLVLAVAALTQPAGAQTAPTLRVAMFPSEAAGQLYYATELGLFKKAGLDVQIIELKNGAAIAAGVAGGAADIGFSNMISLGNAHERGIPFTIIQAGGLAVSSEPTNGILAVAAGSPLHTAKDLTGKTVGIDVLGGLPLVANKAWVDANGGDSKSVKYIEVPFAEMTAAVTAGRIDAASMNLSIDPTIGKPGDPLRTLAVVYDAIAPRFASSMWFSSNDFIAKNPDAIKKFVAALRQAGLWANTHHHESALMLSKYIKQPAETIEGGARVAFPPNSDPVLFQAQIDIAAKYGALKTAFPVTEMLAR